MSKRIAGISLAGLAMIMGFEGVRLTGYLDPVGIPTICSGHTKRVRIGQVASYADCQMMLKEDTKEAGKAVSSCTAGELTQQQYDSLVSLAFNIGGNAYCSSTLVKKWNSGDCSGAADQFLRWNKAGGRVLPGLVKRRAAERKLFIKGCP